MTLLWPAHRISYRCSVASRWRRKKVDPATHPSGRSCPSHHRPRRQSPHKGCLQVELSSETAGFLAYSPEIRANYIVKVIISRIFARNTCKLHSKSHQGAAVPERGLKASLSSLANIQPASRRWHQCHHPSTHPITATPAATTSTTRSHPGRPPPPWVGTAVGAAVGAAVGVPGGRGVEVGAAVGVDVAPPAGALVGDAVGPGGKLNFIVKLPNFSNSRTKNV